MDKLNELIEMLNSDRIISKMYDYYMEVVDYIHPNWKNASKFVSYLKAYYIERYLSVPDSHKRMLYLGLVDGELNVGLLETFLEKTNGSLAKQNECMEKESIYELKNLLAFVDEPLYEELDKENKWISGFIKEKNGFITLSELKNGDYIYIDGYKLDKDEIKTIENAKMVPGVINIVHSLYDDFADERNILNYDSIEDKVLKKLAFHTDKDNPKYDILFDDGTIITYYKGDIRFCPLNFIMLVNLVKLTFVDNYLNGEDNQFFQFLIEKYDLDLEVPYEDMDDETMEILLSVANEMVYNIVESLSLTYSKKMIEDSKKDVKKMKELVKKYKL